MKCLARAMLSLLCLLFFATSVSAECAWVLWVTTDSPSGSFKGSTEPNAAFTTRAECDALEKRVTPNLEQKLKKQFPDGWVNVRCLPDTVDPRGQKEK
jgi:hypothetical protein